MGKLILLLALVGVVVWWAGARARRVPPPAGGGRRRSGTEEMVVCAHCGTHLPRSEALYDEHHPYCGETHRLAGPRPGPGR